MAKLSVIHLSDLHIGRRDKETDRMTKIIGRIAKSYPKTPVIITGDLTDSATKGQFEKTRGLLSMLAETNPILAVPGNHDYAWKGTILRPDGWGNWVKFLGSPRGWGRPEVPWMELDHEPRGVDGLGVWKNGPIVYFGIDSGDPEGKQASARGYISRGLAAGLRESLVKYAGKTRIAILHHHPFTAGLFTKLHGSERLIKAIRGNCELLIFGHEHRLGRWWNKYGVPLIVASHKSTNKMAGNNLMISLIDIYSPGTQDVSFQHRLEVI